MIRQKEKGKEEVMKTLYIHIGTPKTGSSAIQAFLRQNQHVLEEKGVYYPRFPFRYDYVLRNRNGYFLRGERLGSRHPDFVEGMRLIGEAFEKYPNIILTEEGIWYETRKWHNQLSDIMRKKRYDVKIIVYIRRQDEYVLSRWNQFIKSYFYKYRDRKTDDAIWENYLQRALKDSKLNYFTTLKRLEEIYGEGNVLVRRYDRSYFSGGKSICADFLQTIGLEQTDEYTDAEVAVNPSLSPNTAEIQRILNTVVINQAEENVDDVLLLRDLLLSYSGLSRENYPCSMFSEEEAEEFMKHYHKGNCKVAKKYFGEEELFPLRGKAAPKWEKGNPNMQDDIIRFMGLACMYFLEENRKIRKELQELKLFRKKVRHPIHTLGEKLSNKSVPPQRADGSLD